MQIAVVGTGIIGMDHLAAIADLEDFTLCAVCDINEEKARQVAVQYGVCLLYTSPSPRDSTSSRMPSSA